MGLRCSDLLIQTSFSLKSLQYQLMVMKSLWESRRSLFPNPDDLIAFLPWRKLRFSNPISLTLLSVGSAFQRILCSSPSQFQQRLPDAIVGTLGDQISLLKRFKDHGICIFNIILTCSGGFQCFLPFSYAASTVDYRKNLLCYRIAHWVFSAKSCITYTIIIFAQIKTSSQI